MGGWHPLGGDGWGRPGGASLAFLEPSSLPLFPPMAEWGLRAPAEHGLQPGGPHAPLTCLLCGLGRGWGRGIGGLRIITVNCSWNRPCRGCPGKLLALITGIMSCGWQGSFAAIFPGGLPSAPPHTDRPPHTCWPQRGPGRDGLTSRPWGAGAEGRLGLTPEPSETRRTLGGPCCCCGLREPSSDGVSEAGLDREGPEEGAQVFQSLDFAWGPPRAGGHGEPWTLNSQWSSGPGAFQPWKLLVRGGSAPVQGGPGWGLRLPRGWGVGGLPGVR